MATSVTDTRWQPPPWVQGAGDAQPLPPASFGDLPLDVVRLITRDLPPSSWRPWRATCRATRDTVHEITTRLRVDISRDGPLPLAPPPAATVARLSEIHAYTHKQRHDDGPTLAASDALTQLADWVTERAPATRLCVYVRCERAALDFDTIRALAASRLLARAHTLSLRADGVRSLHIRETVHARCGVAGVAPGLRVTAEVKVAEGDCTTIPMVASWPLTRLTVLAAVPGPGAWPILGCAVATLATLDLAAGTPLATALGNGEVWRALTDLTLRGHDGPSFLNAWPAHCAPMLARVRCVGGAGAWRREGVVVERC